MARASKAKKYADKVEVDHRITTRAVLPAIADPTLLRIIAREGNRYQRRLARSGLKAIKAMRASGIVGFTRDDGDAS